MITMKLLRHCNSLRKFYLFAMLLLLGCTVREAPAQGGKERIEAPVQEEKPLAQGEKLSRVLAAAEIPPETAQRIMADFSSGTGAFFPQFEKILAGDPYLRRLVDKQHPLPENYEPDGLIELRYKSYGRGIPDLMLLRGKAEEALEEMAAAARTAGFALTVSSAYRSYQYQIGSFERWTARLGLEEAERVSARAGRSQHQLALVVDFGSITNDFAGTATGKWVAANASRFGFSLSYPRGYERVTGYAWESWHYRYVGRELAAFIDTWFGGIQQYALRFIYEWEAPTLANLP
jgi:D-alanyl-D-alanine carboxypeptidase